MPPQQQQQQQETVSDSDSDNEEECIICANPIIWYAVGPCNHRTCHVCALRLRALYKNTNCTYCKAEQPSVVFTAHPSKLFDVYTRQELQHHDEKTKIYFDNKEIYEGTMIFLLFNCPDDKCDVSCRGGWSELKTHVKTVHNRLLCDLCTRFKKVFYHEHTLFTPVELDRHLRGEDYLNETQMCGFKGHPKCGFCKIAFYGADELFEHCRKTHEQCFLCQRMGVDGARDQFYANYDTLEKHFNSDHILCEDKACLAHKFVVFATDIDFKAHLREKHPRYCANQRQRSEQRRAMQVQVNFTYAGGQDQSRDMKGRERRFGNEENNAPMRSEVNQPERRRPGSGNPDVFTLPGRGAVPNNGMNPGREQNARQQRPLRAPDGFGEFSIVGQPQSLSQPFSQGSLPQQTVQSIPTGQRQQEHWPGLGEVTGVANITKSSKNATSRKSPPGSGRVLDNERVGANSQTQEFSEVVKSDTVWDGKKLQLEGYPTLKASDTAVSAATSTPAKLDTRKVLVIKSRESSSARWGTGGRETWDRIAKAASSTLTSSPLQQPPQSPVAMATPYNSKSSTQPKAWTGSSLLLTSPAPLPVSSAPAIQTRPHPNRKPARPEAFPSLPRAATPTYPTWGKKGTGSMASSAWSAPRSGGSNDQEEEDMQLALALSLSDVHIDSSAARKKNAKKKKVLLHFG